MAIWKELHTGQGLGEGSGGRAASRTFRSESLVEVTINEASENLASFGNQHPRHTDLVVNNSSYVPQGGGTLVQVQYVLATHQDPIPPEDTTTEEWIAIDTTFEDIDVEIPVFQKVTKSFGEGAALVEKTVYEVVKNSAVFRYSRTVHRITLNAIIAGGEGVMTQLAISQAVNQETNKIHTIGGVRYLFKADGIRRISPDQYQFTYRWIFDPGVPDTLVYDDPQVTINLGSIGGYLFPHEVHDTEKFIIKPYNRMDYGPGELPEDVPVITFSPAYVENAGGAFNLPGVS